ncbi:MAG: hypothetical protein JWO38_6282 [Gemmataceae bacterium]|nr:hypothetical protein [Gemmataceae bacterium]
MSTTLNAPRGGPIRRRRMGRIENRDQIREAVVPEWRAPRVLREHVPVQVGSGREGG